MNLFTAARMVWSSPYAFRRKHEWRPFSVNYVAPSLFPHITIAWWTWDTLPDPIGQRVAEVVDTLREPPERPVAGQGVCL
jgi:hypothetical protein